MDYSLYMKYTLILCILACLLFVSGCTAATPLQQNDAGQETPQAALEIKESGIDICKEQIVDNQLKLDVCLNDYARESNDVEACHQISVDIGPYNQPSRNVCYRTVAAQTMDLDVCNNLPEVSKRSPTDKEYCINGVYFAIALDKKDPALCRLAAGSTERDCYTALAAELLDVSICDNLESGYVQSDCYENVALQVKDPSLCLNLEPEFKDSCLFALSKEENFNDAKLCDLMSSAFKKSQCLTLPRTVYENNGFSVSISVPEDASYAIDSKVPISFEVENKNSLAKSGVVRVSIERGYGTEDASFVVEGNSKYSGIVDFPIYSPYYSAGEKSAKLTITLGETVLTEKVEFTII
jgi:hypothetical protein